MGQPLLSLPYKVVGGTRFYDRREVKDAMAYLRTVVNPTDEVSLKRVLNTPKRGVGDASVDKLDAFARAEGLTFVDALRRCEEAGVSGKALRGIGQFIELLDGLDALVGYSAAIHEQRNSNQIGLFGEAGDDLPEPRIAGRDDWLPAERLGEEFAAIGFYLSGHPLDDYMVALKRKDVKTLAQLQQETARGPVVGKLAGIVSSRQERKSARGNRFAFLQASDPTGAYEAMVFSDTLDASREHLEPGSKVILQVEAQQESDQLKLLCRAVTPMDEAVSAGVSAGLRIFLENADGLDSLSGLLARIEKDASLRTRGPLYLCLLDDGLPGEVDVELPGLWPVNPQVKGALRSHPSVATVEEL